MSVSEALARFGDRWLPRLNSGAKTMLHHGPLPGETGIHSAIADAFVVIHGYSPIGFNWELLDASPDASGPRSALTQLRDAMANAISNPNKAWLGAEKADRCASEFLGAFDPATRTVVSNRYDGLWNPIAGKSVEWGFVAFDDLRIALLLICGD